MPSLSEPLSNPDDLRDNRMAFEMAMQRVKSASQRKGVQMNFRQLLEATSQELEREIAHLKQRQKLPVRHPAAAVEENED